MTDPASVQQTGDGILVANTGTVHGSVTVTSAAEAFRVEEFPFEEPGGQPASLSGLLRAARRTVAFTGRVAELARLQSWRDGPGRLSVTLISGPGGQGKTRLAGKFAAESASAGWAVARARHRSDPQPPTPLAAVRLQDRADILVIADYAERWPQPDLKQLLQHRLLARAGRTRVVLLARPAGYWWRALASPLAKLAATADELPLGPLADTVAQRKTAFTAARDRFAEILGAGGVSRLQPAGSLADDDYQLALTLHMAALVAVDAHTRRVPAPDDPGQLSRYLIDREYDHWETMRANSRISSPAPTMARLVALATLTQSVPHATGLGLLRAAGLADGPAGAQALLDDHAACYPATGGPGMVLEPLLPDRLGEDFIAGLMPTDAGGDPWAAGLLRSLAAQAGGNPPAWAAAAVSVLIETGQRWEHVRQGYLGPLLRERPGLALAAGGAALVTLAGYADPDVLMALKAVLPGHRHVELDGGIAALTSRLTDYGLEQATDDAERARLHEDMAERFSNAGLRGEALSASQDAIAIRRRLALADPASHEPMLANSLGNMGIDLWGLGRSADALDAMREAVAIYRRRDEAEPGAYEEDLAAELSNLAGSLLDLQRYKEALAPATEAAAIFRQRAGVSSSLRNELGSSLRNLAVILNGVGQPEEALSAAQEAVANYRLLAGDRPEAHEVELADALRSLSSRLSRVRDLDAALRAAEESVTISRRLAAANPRAHEPNLALALHGLASRLWDTRRRQQSLAASGEAVDLQRRLTEEHPRAHERAMGVILNTLASHLAEESRPQEALAACEEALAIWRRIDPAPGSPGPQLVRALETRNRALSVLGRQQGKSASP